MLVVVVVLLFGDMRGTPDTGDRLRPPRRLVVVGRNGGGEPPAAFILIPPPTILLPLFRLFGEMERVEPGRASESISTGILRNCVECRANVSINLYAVVSLQNVAIAERASEGGRERVKNRQRKLFFRLKSRVVLDHNSLSTSSVDRIHRYRSRWTRSELTNNAASIPRRLRFSGI